MAKPSNKSALTASATSAKTDEWRTPTDLIGVLSREFRFVLDLAASAENRIVPGYFGLDHESPDYRDAIGCDWARLGRWIAEREPGGLRTAAGFLNPPFSILDDFIKKAGDEKALGFTTVAVLPNRCEKAAWHEDLAARASEIRTLQGRLKYWRIAVAGEVVGRGESAWVAKGGEVIEDSALFASVVVIWRGHEPEMRGGARSLFWDWRALVEKKSRPSKRTTAAVI